MLLADRFGTDPRGQRGVDARAQYLWQGIGVVAVIGVAIVLFLATLWLSEGQGPVSQVGAAAVMSPAAPPAGASKTVELPPVPLTVRVAPVPGVVFGVGALQSVDVVNPAPGEAAALRFALTLRNDTDTTVSLRSTLVNLYAGTGQHPMLGLAQADGVPLPDTVSPGATATGVFLFAVPIEDRSSVKIAVDYAVGVPRVAFVGAAPR